MQEDVWTFNRKNVLFITQNLIKYEKEVFILSSVIFMSSYFL